jgi:hypothetical protein
MCCGHFWWIWEGSERALDEFAIKKNEMVRAKLNMMVKCIVEKSEIKKFEVLFGKFLLVLNRVRNLRNEAGYGENRSLLYIATTMHRIFFEYSFVWYVEL